MTLTGRLIHDLVLSQASACPFDSIFLDLQGRGSLVSGTSGRMGPNPHPPHPLAALDQDSIRIMTGCHIRCPGSRRGRPEKRPMIRSG